MEEQVSTPKLGYDEQLGVTWLRPRGKLIGILSATFVERNAIQSTQTERAQEAERIGRRTVEIGRRLAGLPAEGSPAEGLPEGQTEGEAAGEAVGEGDLSEEERKALMAELEKLALEDCALTVRPFTNILVLPGLRGGVRPMTIEEIQSSLDVVDLDAVYSVAFPAVSPLKAMVEKLIDQGEG